MSPLTSGAGAHPGTLSTSQSAAGTGTAYASDSAGPTLFVNSANGQDYYSGLTPAEPLATIGAAFDKLEAWNEGVPGSSSNATIYIAGDFREQLTTPLGVYGVRIIGLANGNGRNTTANGVVLPGNGVQWRSPASPVADTPLLTVREQGWEFHNFFMYPSASQVAIRLRREETASYPDASHAKFVNMRFFGADALGTAAGQAIDDYGGQYNVSVQGCQFVNLEYAIYASNVSIATPLMWHVGDLVPNIFQLNKRDVYTNASGWVVGANQHLTLYNASTHPDTLNLARSATGTYPNRIEGPYFADATADITVGKGYKPGNAADVWGYFSTNSAARLVANPT